MPWYASEAGRRLPAPPVTLDVERIAPVGELDQVRLGRVRRPQPDGASRAGPKEHDVDFKYRRIAAGSESQSIRSGVSWLAMIEL